MWNKPTEEELAKLPKLYANEENNTRLQDVPIHMHFFFGGSDWYVAEWDPEDRVFWGFAILNGDLVNAEWGYFALDELAEIKIPPGFEIDLDLYWKVRKASEVPKIQEAQGWLDDEIQRQIPTE